MDLLSPVPLAIEDRPYKSQMHEALIRELFLRSKAALVLLILTLVLTWKLFGATAENNPALPWVFLGLSVIASLRLISILVLEGQPKLLPSPGSRHMVFLAGSTLVGLAFAAISWLVVPLLDPIQLSLFCLILTGINSVAMLSMAGSPVAYGLYMLPNLGSFALISPS